jgi:hypothetical protein
MHRNDAIAGGWGGMNPIDATAQGAGRTNAACALLFKGSLQPECKTLRYAFAQNQNLSPSLVSKPHLQTITVDAMAA